MKLQLFSILLFLSALNAIGQEKKFEELNPTNIEWSQGSVLLNDGEEIKGLIRFNDRTGNLSIDDGSESRSFTSRHVTGFEFYDDRLERQRVFYSVEAEDPRNNVKRPLFFELLKDFKSFAVLSKLDPIQIKETNSSYSNNYGYGGGQATTIITQTETIYFLDQDGKLESYLKLTRKVVDGGWYDREKTKRKILDDGLLQKYFKEPGLSAMVSYAEEHKLEFDVKEDLITILEQYKVE